MDLRAPMELDVATPTDTRSGPPWLTLWTSPRATMRYVLDHEAEYTFVTYGIAAVYGIVTVLGGDFQKFFGSDIPLVAKFALALLVGPLMGLLGIFMGGFLASAVGRMFGGTGSVDDLRPALAWGILPVTVTGVLAVPSVLVLTPALEPHLAADAEMPAAMLLPSLAVLLGAAAMVVGWAWSLVTTTKCVAEAHRFSAWRALAIPVVISGAGFAVAMLMTAVFR